MSASSSSRTFANDEQLIRLALGMKRHTVGPLFVDEFFGDFAGSGEGEDGRLNHIPSANSRSFEETSLTEALLVKQVESYGALVELSICDTHDEPLRSPRASASSGPSWTVYSDGGSHAEIFGVRMPAEEDDPFVDRPDQDSSRARDFMKDDKPALVTVGRLVAQASDMFELQPRTHVFSFLVCGRRARLLCFDRAGCVVTESFDVDETPYLYEFLRRYEHMSKEARGHDPSVTFDVTDEEAALAIEILKAGGAASDEECKREHLRRVRLIDDHRRDENGSPLLRELIATRPRYVLEAVEGVATRGGLAVLLNLDPAAWKIAYLKDTHRFDDEDEDSEFMKEGDVYELLHAKGVRNIPVHLCSGDAIGEWQQTRTDRFADLACRGVTLSRRQHYYTVLGTVGKPLSEYKTTFQLADAISDALDAHADAFEKAGLLHRDISPGNILLTDGGGMLIDWQFARTVVVGRQPQTLWRVGSSRYHSYGLYGKAGNRAQELRDDLESFFWVFLYMIVRYRPLRLHFSDVFQYIRDTFDETRIHDLRTGDVLYGCGDKKLACLRGDFGSLGNDKWFCNAVPVSLRKLLAELRGIFKPLYPIFDAGVEYDDDDLQPVPDDCIPDVPVERYHALSQKLGRRLHKHEHRAVSDAWAEEYNELRRQGRHLHLHQRRVLPDVPEAPVIDYTPVNSHLEMQSAFAVALMRGEQSAGWTHYDGAAVDQMPMLQPHPTTQSDATSLAGSSDSDLSGSSGGSSGRSSCSRGRSSVSSGRSSRGNKRSASPIPSPRPLKTQKVASSASFSTSATSVEEQTDEDDGASQLSVAEIAGHQADERAGAERRWGVGCFSLGLRLLQSVGLVSSA